MKFYGKAEAVARNILQQFENGNIAEPMATIFIRRRDNIPCRSWSFMNQMIVIFSGSNDARGFKQWRNVGRKVKKGAKAIYILAPCIGKKKNEETEEEEIFVYGFRSLPVFKIEDTEIYDFEKWEKASADAINERKWVESLPLIEVAKKWNLKVDTYNAREHGARGWYRHGSEIALGVRNLRTWFHELAHAADDKCGNIKKGMGQDESNEIVADLGAAVLMKMIGKDDSEIDYGSHWQYIQAYSSNEKDTAIKRAMGLVKRVCAAVDKILETAEEMKAVAV